MRFFCNCKFSRHDTRYALIFFFFLHSCYPCLDAELRGKLADRREEEPRRAGRQEQGGRGLQRGRRLQGDAKLREELADRKTNRVVQDAIICLLKVPHFGAFLLIFLSYDSICSTFKIIIRSHQKSNMITYMIKL